MSIEWYLKLVASLIVFKIMIANKTISIFLGGLIDQKCKTTLWKKGIDPKAISLFKSS